MAGVSHSTGICGMVSMTGCLSVGVSRLTLLVYRATEISSHRPSLGSTSSELRSLMLGIYVFMREY